MNLELFKFHWQNCQDSGMSQQKYAESIGINYATWQYWRRKVRQNQTPPISGSFLKIRTEANSPSPSLRLEVSGVTLWVPGDFDPNHLSAVLHAIRSAG